MNLKATECRQLSQDCKCFVRDLVADYRDFDERPGAQQFATTFICDGRVYKGEALDLFEVRQRLEIGVGK
jgi:hypothetical protein